MANADSFAAPPSVLAIRAAADWIRGHRRLAALTIIGGLALIILSGGVYTVGNGESAARRRFGRVVDAAIPPGLGMSLPLGIDRVTRVRTGEVLRAEIAVDENRALALVTGDENFIEVAVVVQYTIVDLGAYLFAAEDPQALLTHAVRAALVETVSTLPVDDVLTSGKAAIQQRVRQHAQAALDRFGAGIALAGVNLQSVTPPLEAAQAFRDVNDAKADAARAINRGQGERERAVHLARGEASRIVQEARAHAAARVLDARGATDRFVALVAQRREAPRQTDTALYYASAQKVLARARLVLLAPGEPPHIDLNLLDRPRP